MLILPVAVLSCSASLALALVPSGVLPTTGRSSAVRRPRPPRIQRRLSTKLLFSPEHGDGGGPISVVRPKKRKAGEGGGGGGGGGVGSKSVAPKKAGGWGAWEKVVSQREDQENVLKRFNKEGEGMKQDNGLVVRTGKRQDMLNISHLCVDTFRGPFEWWMLPLQLFEEFTFFGQVNGRLGRVTRNDMQHSMVVVEDTTSGSVVGFLEIGMLPRPTSSEENALSLGTTAAGTTTTEEASEKDEDASTPAAAYTGSDVDGVVEDSRDEGDAGVTAIRRAPDVAYLANVVVDRNQRRRGIGRTMVNASIQIVRELWPGEDRIYVTVEKGNDIAVALYEGMGFELAALEDDMLARSRKRPPRIYLSKTLQPLID